MLIPCLSFAYPLIIIILFPDHPKIFPGLFLDNPEIFLDYRILSQNYPLIFPGFSLDYLAIILRLFLNYPWINPWLSRIIPWFYRDYPQIIPGLSLDFPLTIPGLSWDDTSIKAGESKLLLFGNFLVNFFFFPTGSIEELALLKIVKNDARIKF